MFFDPVYFLFIIPPLLLGFYAQWKVKSSFAAMSKVRARMTGEQAARRMLDSAGLSDVEIEQVSGHLSDHYDPRSKVLRLSPDVYNGQSMAAVGVACHEAGHAFQDAKGYAPLAIRNLAVPAANFGSSAGMTLLFVGLIFSFKPTGIDWFAAVCVCGLFSIGESAGGIQCQQSRSRGIGFSGNHCRQRGTVYCQGPECRGTDLCCGNAAVGHDVALFRDAGVW